MRENSRFLDKKGIKEIGVPAAVLLVLVVILLLFGIKLPITLEEADFLKQIVSGEVTLKAPVYLFALNLWMKIMGLSLLRVRLFSLGCMVAAMLAILFLVKAWFGGKAGTIGILLFGCVVLFTKAGIYAGPFAFRMFWVVLVMVIILGLTERLSVWKGLKQALFPEWIIIALIPVCLIGTVLLAKEGSDREQQVEKSLEVLKQVEAESRICYDVREMLPLYEYYLPGKQLVWYEELDFEKTYPDYIYVLSTKEVQFPQAQLMQEEMTTIECGNLTLESREITLKQVDWGYAYREAQIQLLNDKIAELGTSNIMVSMFPMENYSPEYFEHYIGIDVAKLDNVLDKGAQLTGVLERVLEENAGIKHVYIGLSPEKMGENYAWDDELLALIRSREDIKFFVLLSYPKISELATKSREEFEHYQAKLTEAVNHVASAKNAMVFYVGAQEWLIANEDNYIDEERLQDDVAQNIFALTWVDAEYQIKESTVETQMQELTRLVEKYKTGSYVFKDWSDYDFIYLGDSVIGNYGGSCSIPGVVSFLTNANYYNCAVGGLSATTPPGMEWGINTALDAIFSGEVEVFSEKPQAMEFMRKLYEDGLLAEGMSGENLIIFVNFGLNDYYGEFRVGEVTDTTEGNLLGSLRIAIERLQERCPKAQIVLLTPNQVSTFDYGTVSRNGTGEILVDFVEGINALAAEMNIPCIDIYADSGIVYENVNETTADGTHPNERGRFLFGTRIAEYLDTIR